MRHQIPTDRLGPAGEGMAQAVESCVHCGFCLPTCPTYRVLGEEMDSPRGRIVLMKEVLEGQASEAAAQPHIEACLGCMACETSCPSGVAYGHLLTAYRARASEAPQGGPKGWLNRLLLQTLMAPARLRLAARLAPLARPWRRWLPPTLRAALDLLPRRLPAPVPMPEVLPAVGRRRARVALLAGCAQRVLAPEIHLATCRVLAANGVEVLTPAGQGCCGSLALHVGDQAAARRRARHNLRLFLSREVDAVLTHTAGCGSGMREYGTLFAGQPDAEEAARLAARVWDATAFLHQLGPLPPSPLPGPLRLAYHDACHLAHAQGVRAEPRALLAAIPGLELVEPGEWELCCGSAGTYNLDQPQIAERLGRRKAEHLLATDPQAIATGNIGCLRQIRHHLQLLGQPRPVWHTMQVLERAYCPEPDRKTGRS